MKWNGASFGSPSQPSAPVARFHAANTTKHQTESEIYCSLTESSQRNPSYFEQRSRASRPDHSLPAQRSSAQTRRVEGCARSQTRGRQDLPPDPGHEEEGKQREHTYARINSDIHKRRRTSTAVQRTILPRQAVRYPEPAPTSRMRGCSTFLIATSASSSANACCHCKLSIRSVDLFTISNHGTRFQLTMCGAEIVCWCPMCCGAS